MVPKACDGFNERTSIGDVARALVQQPSNATVGDALTAMGKAVGIDVDFCFSPGFNELLRRWFEPTSEEREEDERDRLRADAERKRIDSMSSDMGHAAARWGRVVRRLASKHLALIVLLSACDRKGECLGDDYDAYKCRERREWIEPCHDESRLLATTFNTPVHFKCPNQHHRMQVTPAAGPSNEEFGAVVFCECKREALGAGGAP